MLHLATHHLVLKIDLGADACGAECLGHLHGVIVMLGTDRNDTYLRGTHPEGKRARVFFNEEGERSLVAAEGGTVDDVRGDLLAGAVGVFHAELLGKQHIDLDGDDGVLFAEDVLALNIQLRPVEGSLVDADLVIKTDVIKDLLHDRLCLIPLLGRSLILIGTGGIPLREAEGAVLTQTDGIQHIHGKIQTAAELLLQLVGAQNEVTLGNGELTYADQAVHLARVLVAEEGRGLAVAQGQIAVGARTVEVCLILEGAGHGAEGKAFLGFICGVAEDEHAVKVVIPVSRDAVKLTLGHKGGHGEQVAAACLLVLYKALEGLNDLGTLGEQDRQTLSDGFHRGEEAKLTAELVVVALSCLLDLGDVFLQLGLAREGVHVYALEHGAA